MLFRSLVDTTKNNSLLYLPLDKIVAQVSAESAQVASGQATSAGSTVPAANSSVTVGSGAITSNPAPMNNSTAPGSPVPSNADKRDSLRSRDREAR